MSVQSEIDRINTNVQDTLSTIADTGVAVASDANSDDLPAAAAALANEKQDKLTGTSGQMVGFDADGHAAAVDNVDAESVLFSDGRTLQQKYDNDELAGPDSVDYEPLGTAAALLNRTTAVNAADTGYTTYKARGEALFNAETSPTVNGAIAWQYE